MTAASPPHAAPLVAAQLALLTVSYQTEEEVLRLVESLRAQPPQVPWHLVIVDNASPDGSGARLAAAFDGATDVTLLLSATNRGFGQANTWAAQQVAADFLGFINPDCVIEAEPFTAAIAYLEAHPEIGVVGPQFFRPWGELEATVRTFPTLAAGFAGRQSLLRKVWRNNPWSRRYLIEDQAADAPMVCDWVVGTLMVVRRAEFLQLGGFDPDYFLYWEDCDLCWRYRKVLNLGTVYLPAGRVVHAAEAAAAKVRPFAVRQFHQAAYTLVRKHLYPSPLHPVRWLAWIALQLRMRWKLWRSSGATG